MPSPSSRTRTAARLRGVGVLLACALLPAPALLAAGDSGAGPTAGPSPSPTAAPRTWPGDSPEERVLAAARAQVGEGYRWGASGPDLWDCSGLTSWAWREAGGVQVPRTSSAQQAWAVPLPAEQLLPGDLVFWGDPVSHVALYVGDGRVVDASSSRNGVLERPVWRASVVRYGRVPREGMTPVTPWTPPPSPSPAAAEGSPDGTRAEDGGPRSSNTGSSVPGEQGSAPSTPAPRSSSPSPQPVTSPTSRATPSPATSPTTSPAPRPTSSATPESPARTGSGAPTPSAAPSTSAAPAAGPWREPRVPVAQAGLPARPAASTARALRAVRGARSVTGTRHFTSTGLVREAWRHAGGGLLPRTPAQLLARGRAVPLGDARVGDVVSYGAGEQLYLYAGSGYMVGHSARHGSVVVRRVHQDPTLRLVRLPG